MTTATETKSIKFAVVAALALGAQFEGGTYGGITTKPDGNVCAVVYLGISESSQDHAACIAYATERDGELATRAVFHLLRSTIKDQLPKGGWCFTADLLSDDTGDKDDASFAWYCHLGSGSTGYGNTSARGRAVVVRLIHIED